MSYHCFALLLGIATRLTASIPRFVYTSSEPLPLPTPVLHKPTLAAASTSIFSFFRSSPTPTAPPTPAPPLPPVLNPLEVLVSTLELKIIAAAVKVGVSRAFEIELERATKKKPPAETRVAIVFTGKEAFEKEGKNETDVFQGLKADLDGGTSKIFIGHATGKLERRN